MLLIFKAQSPHKKENDPMKEEQYYLQNDTTKLYLTGFQRQKPLWTGDEKSAALYDEMTVLRMERRLANLYSPAHRIIIKEKAQ